MNIKIDALSEKIKGQHSRYQTIVMVFALILLCGLFSIPGLPGGDDWLFFHYTVQRIVSAEPLYLINAENTNPSNTANFYPPWVSLTLLIPGLLPPNIGRGIISMVNLVIVVLIARKYNLSLIKQLLALFTPAMFLMLLHGHIDGFLLGALLLPKSWWLIGSLTKPQVSIAYFTLIPRKNWLHAIVITGCIIVFSFLLFGLWPLEMLKQPRDIMFTTAWGSLWPNQIPIGLFLVFLAWQKKNELLAITASPFFMPYISINALIGPWITLSSLLNDFQAVIVLISWWLVSIYQIFQY